MTKKYVFVDNLDQVVEDGKDEEYKMTEDKGERSMSELENIKVVLDYLKEKSNKATGKAVLDWVKYEIEQKEKEYLNLSIVNADDKEIISQALVEMSDKYRVNNQFDAANKIDAVRERFLADETGKYVKTNLNNYVKVKLNDYGKQIHHDDWKDICKESGVPYELKVDEKGYSEFQIHEFMNTFGEYAHIGTKLFLETNDILIERSNK